MNNNNSQQGNSSTIEEKIPNSLHPSHKTRFSMDASSYDEICINCGHTDIATGGWGELAKPCPNPDGLKKD